MTAFDYKTATVAQINTAIADIKATGKKWQQDVQDVLLACYVQIQAHRNTTPLNALILAIPEGGRRAAVIVHATRFGGVELNKGKNKDKQPVCVFEGTPDVALALANPWWKVKTEKPVETLVDAAASLDRLLHKLLKAADEGRTTEEDKALILRVNLAFRGSQAEATKAEGEATEIAVPGGVAEVPAALLAQAGELPAQVH